MIQFATRHLAGPTLLFLFRVDSQRGGDSAQRIPGSDRFCGIVCRWNIVKSLESGSQRTQTRTCGVTVKSLRGSASWVTEVLRRDKV